jgi:hypothetical protein
VQCRRLLAGQVVGQKMYPRRHRWPVNFFAAHGGQKSLALVHRNPFPDPDDNTGWL